MDLEFLNNNQFCSIPVVDGRLLHSSVNPIREARWFIDQSWEKIKGVKNIIVLGLGGGYHIQELMDRQHFHVVVIEPLAELVAQMRERNPSLMACCEIIQSVSPSLLADEPAIVKAFSSSVVVLSHPPSVHVHGEYFGKVLSTLMNRTMGSLIDLSRGDPHVHDGLLDLSLSREKAFSCHDLEVVLRRPRRRLKKRDFIWLALRELVV